MPEQMPPISAPITGGQANFTPPDNSANTTSNTVPVGISATGSTNTPADTGFNADAANADLMQMRDGLNAKEAQSNNAMMLSENELNNTKQQIMGVLFEALKKAGVDPSDLQSIGQFLDSLKEQDPDLYGLFDYAFSSLIGQSPTTQPPEMSGNFVPQPGQGDVPQTGAPTKGPQDLTNLTATLG